MRQLNLDNNLEKKEGNGNDFEQDEINDFLLSLPESAQAYDYSLLPKNATIKELEDQFLNPKKTASHDFWFRRVFLFYQKFIYKRTDHPKFVVRLREAYIEGDLPTKTLIMEQLEEWSRCYYRDLNEEYKKGDLNVFFEPIDESKGASLNDNTITKSASNNSGLTIQVPSDETDAADYFITCQEAVKMQLEEGKRKFPEQMKLRENRKKIVRSCCRFWLFY